MRGDQQPQRNTGFSHLLQLPSTHLSSLSLPWHPHMTSFLAHREQWPCFQSLGSQHLHSFWFLVHLRQQPLLQMFSGGAPLQPHKPTTLLHFWQLPFLHASSWGLPLQLQSPMTFPHFRQFPFNQLASTPTLLQPQSPTTLLQRMQLPPRQAVSWAFPLQPQRPVTLLHFWQVPPTHVASCVFALQPQRPVTLLHFLQFPPSHAPSWIVPLQPHSAITLLHFWQLPFCHPFYLGSPLHPQPFCSFVHCLHLPLTNLSFASIFIITATQSTKDITPNNQKLIQNFHQALKQSERVKTGMRARLGSSILAQSSFGFRQNFRSLFKQGSFSSDLQIQSKNLLPYYKSRKNTNSHTKSKFEENIKMLISRKDYVREPTVIEDDRNICDLCMDVCCEPVVCEGPCKSLTCRKCAALWSGNNSKAVSCPKKCSNPWKYRLAPKRMIEMGCPYNKQCRVNSVQNFQEHISSCIYQPPMLQEQTIRRKKYQCANNHDLHFFISSFEEMTQSFCSFCGEKEVVKSYCPKCDLKYCVKCRVPLCAQDKCPLGHQYYRRVPSGLHVCDICGMAPSLLPDLMIYQDQQCNFDVCELCYAELPASLEESQILFKMKVNSNPNICGKGHKLKNCPSEIQKCYFCTKQKFCCKKCDECNTFFCLKCKYLTVTAIGRCQCSHQFKVTNEIDVCHSCSSTCKIYEDTACNLKLCAKCLSKFIQMESYRRQIKERLYCSKTHKLIVINHQLLQCTGCKVKRVIGLTCPECSEQQSYCYACKRIQTNSTCYLGHELEEIADQNRVCMICMKMIEGKGYECKDCTFIECENCKKWGIKQEIQEKINQE